MEVGALPGMTDFQPRWDRFRELNATRDIRLTIFYDAFGRRPCALCCIICSVAIGVLGAWAQGSRLRVLRAVEFFRHRPALCGALGSYLRTINAVGFRSSGGALPTALMRFLGGGGREEPPGLRSYSPAFATRAPPRQPNNSKL
jgi:hypothetical protein